MIAMWTVMTFNTAEAAGGGEGGAPGGGEAPAAAAAPVNPYEAAGAQPAGGEQGGTIMDRLPQHLRGDTPEQALEKVFAAYSGAREEMGKRGKAVDNPDDYKVEFSEDVLAVVGDPAQDETLAVARNIAHKHGLTQEQFAGFVQDFHGELLAQGKLGGVDVTAEAKKLAGDGAARMSEQDVLNAAAAAWTDATTYIDGLVADKTLTADQANVLRGLAETADGILALKALRGQMREVGVQTGGTGAGQALTKADLDRRIADPRNQALAPEFDPAFAQQTDEMFKQFYGAAA